LQRQVSLRVPKLRTLPFETAITERYRRRESSVEEVLVEMYFAGESVRRVEDFTEALWGTRVSPSTVSELNQKIYAAIEAWRNRAIEGHHPYVSLGGLWLKRSRGGEVRFERARVKGYPLVRFGQVFRAGGESREVLSGSDVAALHGAFLSQRVDGSATSKVKEVAAMLKAIHAQEDRVAARQKAEQVTAKLKQRKLAETAELVRGGIERHCSTTRFRGSTGGVCGRTTRWSASCVRYDEERGRWGVSGREAGAHAYVGQAGSHDRHEIGHSVLPRYEPPCGSE
jgi:putative transposase